MKSRRPASGLEQAGPSGENVQLLNCLDVLDPRLSISAVTNDPSNPTNQLYRALFSTKEYTFFRDWDNTSEPEDLLLWVRGEPGQGKTMVLTGTVQALLSATDQDLPDRHFISFYFFDHAKHGPNNAASALKTILWLIFVYQPDLSTHLSEKLDSIGRQHLNDPNDFLALSAVFYNVIEDERLQKTYIVVDALDECTSGKGQPGVDDFLALITKSATLSKKIRWLISSDGSERFKSKFLNNSCRHVDLSQGLPGMDVAIHDSITAKVRDLVRTKKYDQELAEEVTRELHSASQGNYLWVTIVCEALRSEETWYVTDLLLDVKGTNILDDSLYNHMFSTFEKLPRRDKEFCTKILLTMALVHDTLCVDELDALVHLDKKVDLMNYLKKCSAFLLTDGRRVSFLHPSIKVYVQKQVLDPTTLPQRYLELTQSCIEYVGRTLMKNRRTTKSQPMVGDISTKDEPSYSTLNWITHLAEIQITTNDDGVREKVFWFLQNHFVDWAEDLVLREQLSAAVVKLQSLDLSLQQRESQGPNTGEPLAAAIRDAHLFLRLCQSNNNPKDVHTCNALLFCPTESIIRNMWIKDAFPWLESPPIMDRQWGDNFATFRGHMDWVRSVAFSPDGKLIASGSDDSSVRVWDAETGTTQHRLKTRSGWIYSVAISSRGIVAAGSNDSSITMWDLATGREVSCLPDQPGIVNEVCFSDDGSKLAAASSLIVRIWDLDSEASESGTFKSYVIEHTDTVRSVAFGKGRKLLVTGADDCKVRVWDVSSIWDVETGANCGTHARNDDHSGADGRLKDGSTVRAISENTELGEGKPADDTENGSNRSSDSDRIDRSLSHPVTDATKLRKPLHTLSGHTGAINSVVFSPDSKHIASGSDDGRVRIWDLDIEEPGNEVHESLDARRGEVISVAFTTHRNGYLLTSCTDQAIDIWDPRTREHLQVMRSPSQTLLGVAASPNGACLATGAQDDAVHLWYGPRKPKEPEPASKVGVGPRAPTDLALSPDGRTLAVAQSGGNIFLWDIEASELLNPQMGSGHRRSALSVSFSPNGAMLLSSGADHSVRVCDVKTGKLLHLFLGHKDSVNFSTWSSDGDYVASASDDTTIRIWKIGDRDEQEPQILKHGDTYAMGVSFSPDGKYIATCGNNGNVAIWTSRQGKSGWTLQHRLEGHNDHVLSVLFSPDSKRVFSSGLDRTIRIWNVESGENMNKDLPIKTERPVYKMWFDKRSPSYVMTPYGAKLLDSSSSSPGSSRVPSWCPYTLSCTEHGDEEWIIWHDKKVIFLPINFRGSACGIFGHKVVVCTDLGQVHVYGFSETVTPSTIMLGARRSSRINFGV